MVISSLDKAVTTANVTLNLCRMAILLYQTAAIANQRWKVLHAASQRVTTTSRNILPSCIIVPKVLSDQWNLTKSDFWRHKTSKGASSSPPPTASTASTASTAPAVATHGQRWGGESGGRCECAIGIEMQNFSDKLKHDQTCKGKAKHVLNKHNNNSKQKRNDDNDDIDDIDDINDSYDDIPSDHEWVELNEPQ